MRSIRAITPQLFSYTKYTIVRTRSTGMQCRMLSTKRPRDASDDDAGQAPAVPSWVKSIAKGAATVTAGAVFAGGAAAVLAAAGVTQGAKAVKRGVDVLRGKQTQEAKSSTALHAPGNPAGQEEAPPSRFMAWVASEMTSVAFRTMTGQMYTATALSEATEHALNRTPWIREHFGAVVADGPGAIQKEEHGEHEAMETEVPLMMTDGRAIGTVFVKVKAERVFIDPRELPAEVRSEGLAKSFANVVLRGHATRAERMQEGETANFGAIMQDLARAPEHAFTFLCVELRPEADWGMADQDLSSAVRGTFRAADYMPIAHAFGQVDSPEAAVLMEQVMDVRKAAHGNRDFVEPPQHAPGRAHRQHQQQQQQRYQHHHAQARHKASDTTQSMVIDAQYDVEPEESPQPSRRGRD